MSPRTLLAVPVLALALGAVPATAQAASFSSPSKNIGCVVSTDFGIRCDISDHDWAEPAKPAGCDLDYGQGLFVKGGRSRFVCAGDTALGSRTILGYGKTKKVGRYACTSSKAGMKCANTSTGHGFFLSIQKYQRF